MCVCVCLCVCVCVCMCVYNQKIRLKHNLFKIKWTNDIVGSYMHKFQKKGCIISA